MNNLLLMFAVASAVAQIPNDSKLLGTLDSIQSQILQEERKIAVYTPKSIDIPNNPGKQLDTYYGNYYKEKGGNQRAIDQYAKALTLFDSEAVKIKLEKLKSNTHASS